MKRILIILLICQFCYMIYQDMRESELNQRSLKTDAHKSAPDPDREALYYDWDKSRWVYKDDPVSNYEAPPEFKPNIDSSLVEERGDYTVYIDPDLRPYVQLFFQYAKQHNKKVYIDYKDVYVYFHGGISKTDHAAGQCLTTEYRYEVRIDPATWEKYPLYREQLVMHELGHCILNRGHYDEFIELDGKAIPRSIMHEDWYRYMAYYRVNQQWYIKELFN